MANFFPRWTNWLPLKIAICACMFGGGATAAVWYYFTPKYTNIGYQPNQPIPFPHDIHAGQLGMDCRYCHSFVEVAAHSNVPNTQVCMNCHSQVQKDNPKLTALRASWDSGSQPIQWVQIHKTPDYVYFNHSVHVNRGVSCVSCHGKINEASVVAHEKPLSMGWCIDCHRAPETALRPREEVFHLDWKPEDTNVQEFVKRFGELPGKLPGKGNENTDFSKVAHLTQEQIGAAIKEKIHANPPDTNCWGCHR